jgi:hypothetical protein
MAVNLRRRTPECVREANTVAPIETRATSALLQRHLPAFISGDDWLVFQPRMITLPVDEPKRKLSGTSVSSDTSMLLAMSAI